MKTQTQQAFTKVLIIMVVAIIGLLATIVPLSFLKFREESTLKPSGANPVQIDNAKVRRALDNKKSSIDVPTGTDLFGTNNYIRIKPTCPSGGTYNYGQMDEPPACTIASEPAVKRAFIGRNFSSIRSAVHAKQVLVAANENLSRTDRR